MEEKFRTKLLTMTLILLLSASLFMVIASTTTAQQAPLQAKTYPFIFAVPNPVGIGEEALFAVGIESAVANVNTGWEGLSVTIERPDGKVDKIENIKTDSTGSTGVRYVPSMAGTYYCTMNFPEQAIKYASFGTLPLGTIMLASTTDKYELVVTEDPAPKYPGHALPQEYWTRPIHTDLREWSSIAGNWLQWTNFNRLALGNAEAPETPHILWTKEFQMGGLVGGAPLGEHSVEDGAAYQTKFTNVVALGGTLYYNQREAIYPTDRVVAVDLRTGEERWTRELRTPDGTACSLSFGQAFYWDSYNYHGTFYFLWSTVGNKWHAFDATTGDWIYTIENMPAGSATYGSNVYGDKGEIYIYTVDTAKGWMTLWNSSRVVSNEGSFTPHGKIYNYSKGIEWNVTIPKNLPGAAALYYHSDRVIGMNGTSFGRQFMDCVTNWALDVSPGREGQLLWKENYVPMDEAVILRTVGLGDPETRVFARYCQTTRQWIGFDMDTGKNIWLAEPMESFDYFTFGTVWDGKLYDVAYGGVLFCFDFKTGETLWKFEIKDFFNENLFSNNWGSYSDMFIADGKIYIGSGEHSPIDPNYRGAPFTCIDAQTGEQIFRIDGFYNSYMQTGFLIGDSVVAFMNTYDLQVYAFGKGPSATTVSINDDVITQGNKVLITGTVMDVSPGTKAANRILRFPNGVPAVGDASNSQWMQYVYQQIERPTNATGVPVELFVLDANDNYRSIGTTTTNIDGYYSYLWMPDIEGTYTVYASFAGSESYYPSHAVAAFAVDSVSATPTPVLTPTPSMADLYLVPGIIGIIIAIIAVGAVVIVVLRKQP